MKRKTPLTSRLAFDSITPEQENEQWKDAYNYEGLYMVSSLGRVKSLDRIVVDKNGDKVFFKGRIIATTICKGYVHVTLWKNNKMSCCRVHRLVAMAFIPNTDNKPIINHKNRNRSDNRIENLEWCTHTENVRHAFSFGNFTSCGENHYMAKLTSKDIIDIRKSSLSRRELASMYNVAKNHIRLIQIKKIWKSVA